METRNLNGEVLTLEEAIKKHDRLIWNVVQRFKVRGISSGLELGDLHSIAAEGFIKAFDKFDPDTYDVRFSTYAVPKMIGELQRYFRDNSGDLKFSRRILDLSYKILRDDMKDEPIETLMLHYDTTEELILEAFDFFRLRSARSTNEVVHNNDGDDVTLGDQLGSEEDFTEVNVNLFLDTLTPDQRKVVELSMLGKKQREIGEVLHVSQAHVSRILKSVSPMVEKFLGYPEGYFGDRKPINQKEIVGMKKTKKRVVAGDLERAKELIVTTKMTYQDIAKETGCNQSAVQYWVKKLRSPGEDESPVTVSKIDIPEPTPFPDDDIEIGYPALDLDADIKARAADKELELELQYKEKMMKSEEAAKLAEEHRIKLLEKSKVDFGYSIVSDDITPSDLHTLFTQAGHAASSTGLKKVNVSIFLSSNSLVQEEI